MLVRKVMADDLRRIAVDKRLTSRDESRCDSLVRYLCELHADKKGRPSVYTRAIRNLIGDGEGIFGIIDGYPADVQQAPPERLRAIETRCSEWRWKLRGGEQRLAAAVHERLLAGGIASCVLDGDDVRQALVPTPGYTPQQRNDFYRTLAGLAAMLARQGLVVLVAATAHRRAHRDQARAATPHFLEVYVNTPLDECERRDTKGLFAKARAGELPDVPGIGTPYEPPENPDLIAEGGLSERAVADLVSLTKKSFGP